MPDPNSFVVPANAGPHTPRSIVSNAHSENFLLNKRRWLWVPAFAGTTMEEQHSRHLRRHCERSEAIHSSFFAPRDGLLRFARNDGSKLFRRSCERRNPYAVLYRFERAFRETSFSTSAGGYWSLLSQGRRWRSNIPGISAVIASAAKQSILSLCGEMDCFASLAMTLLWFWIRLHPRDAMRPRRCFYLPPKEGVGNAGCPLHPRSRVQ